jgi:UDP-3-O-[3-hydroxymyristoyl] glucosamine N-acyltransferase
LAAGPITRRGAMTEPLFFRGGPALTLGEIVTLTGARPADGAPLDHRISNIASLQRATASELAFLENAKYAPQLSSTHAGACLVTERFASLVPQRTVPLQVAQPYRAFVLVARKLFPDALRPSSLFEAKAVAPGAFVHDSARLEHGVTVDPGAVIGPRAEIGAGTRIAAGAVIGPDVRIGRDCSIGAVASVMHALIGDRVTIHPGCRIGQDGFGFVPGPKGHVKIPQIGRVIIQDDVEIGAGTAVDRGALGDTSIGEGTKIDNLVQIAHNVSIGRHCLLAGQVGISGSVTIEDFVMLGGQVGVADHVTIGAGAMLAAKAGVMSDVPPRGRWGGAPAEPFRDFLRAIAALRRLSRAEARPRRADERADEGGDE